MAELNTIVPVVIYLSLSFLAALWARKQSQKTSDSHGFIEEYFIGGRSMGGFVLAMSIIASYTSASSFVGGPGVAYKLGLSWVLLARSPRLSSRSACSASASPSWPAKPDP